MLTHLGRDGERGGWCLLLHEVVKRNPELCSRWERSTSLARHLDVLGKVQGAVADSLSHSDEATILHELAQKLSDSIGCLSPESS